MSRSATFTLAMVLGLLIVSGCSSDDVGPLTPPSKPGNGSMASYQDGSHVHLWGYYDIYIDIGSQTATAAPNRHALTTWNVLSLLNSVPPSLGFDIHKTPITEDYVDVDIDVSITHPLTGKDHLNAYDVRGVFMGNASAELAYNSDLRYPVQGLDQVMLEDPDPHSRPWDLPGGAPDGYTRWFNRPEFTTPGVLGYTPGALVGELYEGNATLNPYKYFADGLDSHDDPWEFLAGTGGNGVFSAGATNTRNYYLRFLLPTPGIRLGMAVLANWENRDTHPANAPEAIACSVGVTPDLFHEGLCCPGGGELILDISLFGWDQQPSTVYIESTVLDSVYEFTAEDMVPVGGGDHYSTYHVEIRPGEFYGEEDHEFWVIAECGDHDYTNEFGVPNLADTDPLSAFFRYDLFVSPLCTCPAVGVHGITGMEGNVGGAEQAKRGHTYEGVRIFGKGFRMDPAEARLVMHDDPAITVDAEAVLVDDDPLITCTISIPDTLPLGLYDVYVRNCCFRCGLAENFVEVIE